MSERESQDPRRPESRSNGRENMRAATIVIITVLVIGLLILLLSFLQGGREAEEPDTRDRLEETDPSPEPQSSDGQRLQDFPSAERLHVDVDAPGAR